MIPYQNSRNNGRQQPSALNSSFLTQRSMPPTAPSSRPADPKNAAYRADVRPEFIGRQDQQFPSAPTTRSVAPQSISDQYKLARQQLTNFAPQQGFATEKQRRDFAWEARSDPLGARDKAQEFQRIYGRPAQSQPSPTRRTNFNGPRPRFGA